MEIRCTVEELKELTNKDLQELEVKDFTSKNETPVAGTTDVTIKLDGKEILKALENHD